MHHHPVGGEPLYERQQFLEHQVDGDVQVYPGVSVGHAGKGVVYLDVDSPGGSVGIRHQAGVASREQLSQVPHLVPYGDVVPYQSVLLLRYRGNPVLYPLLHLCFQQPIILDHLRGPPKRHYQRHVDERVKAGERGRPVLSGLEDLLPELDALHRKHRHLGEALQRELAPGLLLQEGDQFQALPPDVLGGMLVGGLVYERCIHEEHGDLEVTGKFLVPLLHSSADVVAAEKEVGPGKASDRAPVGDGRADVQPGVGAEVV